MNSVIIDVNIILDLIKLQMLNFLFKSQFQVYTTQEIIDQLNENQSELLNEFIESGQLTVYRLSEIELEEVTNLTAERAFELADKSVVWLSIHMQGILFSGNLILGRFCQSKDLEAEDMIWFFNQLIKNKLITHAFAAQKMGQLIKINRRILRNECEKKIKEWENASACVI